MPKQCLTQQWATWAYWDMMGMSTTVFIALTNSTGVKKLTMEKLYHNIGIGPSVMTSVHTKF